MPYAEFEQYTPEIVHTHFGMQNSGVIPSSPKRTTEPDQDTCSHAVLDEFGDHSQSLAHPLPSLADKVKSSNPNKFQDTTIFSMKLGSFIPSQKFSNGSGSPTRQRLGYLRNDPQVHNRIPVCFLDSALVSWKSKKQGTISRFFNLRRNIAPLLRQFCEVQWL
nr:hypothetical protein Iba_chr07dCG4380 [Ipomoea batatas]